MIKYTLKKASERLELYCRNNIATDVNDEFLKFTGYTKEEIIGKSLGEISCMLRIDSQIYLENIEDKHNCFVFTKELEPREVTISCQQLQPVNEKVYHIEEKFNSRIENRLPYVSGLFSDNENGIAIYSVKDGLFLKTNEKFLGFSFIQYYEKKKVTGRTLKETVIGYEESSFKKDFLEVIKTGKTLHLREVKHEFCGNAETYWDVSLVPIHISGILKYIVHTASDITEKVLNRKFIEERNKKLEAIIENMSDAIFIIDKEGTYIAANKLSRGILLIPSENHTVKDVYDRIEFLDAKRNPVNYENLPSRRIMRGEKVFGQRLTVIQKDKIIYIEVNATPIYDESGNFIAGVACLRDITENIKFEEATLIKTQNELLNRIIENIDLGIVRCSYSDYKIIDINQKACNFFRLSYTEADSVSSLIGRYFFSHLSAEEQTELITRIEKSIEKKDASFFRYVNYTLNREQVFYKIMYQPLFGLNDQVKDIISIFIDITKEVKARNKIEEALKIQEELFVNISHELKTPLNVIYSTNQLMELYLKNASFDINKETLGKNINVIKQNCNRLIRLINNVVDLSKIDSGFFKFKPSNENIVSIVEDVVQSVSEYTKGKNVNIIFDTDTEEKYIACDSDKIERIMLNLISNAIKFSNSDSSIFVDIADKGDTVEITVRDTGIGIDEKHLESVFNRFHQVDMSLSRKAEGSGIGLALVKSLVEMHGGKISVESKVGKGSIFKIDLPAETIEEAEVIEDTKAINNKIERINVEFSDIYSI